MNRYYFRSAISTTGDAFREGCHLALNPADAALWGRTYNRAVILRVELPELPAFDEVKPGAETCTDTLKSVKLPADMVEAAHSTAVECDEEGSPAPGKAVAAALSAAMKYAPPTARIVAVSPGWFKLYHPETRYVEEIETFQYRCESEEDDGSCANLPDLRP